MTAAAVFVTRRHGTSYDIRVPGRIDSVIVDANDSLQATYDSLRFGLKLDDDTVSSVLLRVCVRTRPDRRPSADKSAAPVARCGAWQSCYDQFMAATRGIPANRVAAILRDLTGVRWLGCSKTHMAEEWAKARAPTGINHSRYMLRVQLPDLVGRINHHFGTNYPVPKPADER